MWKALRYINASLFTKSFVREVLKSKGSKVYYSVPEGATSDTKVCHLSQDSKVVHKNTLRKW